MKAITTYIRGNRSFKIVKEMQNGEYWYMAIEDKYIDEDGRLNTSLNGGQMNASKDMNTCIDRVTKMVDFEYFKSQGMSDAEAFAETFHLPLHVCEEMFA